MAVYFAKAGNTNRVKIGCATSVFKRIQTLQTGCPEPLKVLLILPTGTRKLEKALHKQFSANRVCGEWFQYEPNVSKFVVETQAARREEALNKRLEKEYEAHLEKEQEEYETKCQEEYEKRMEEEYEAEQEKEYRLWMLSQKEEEESDVE